MSDRISALVRHLCAGNDSAISTIDNAGSADVSLFLYIRTGAMFGAGTDSQIVSKIYFIPNGGAAGVVGLSEVKLVLDNKLYNDFEQGQVDVFKIDNVPVGSKIIAISVKNNPRGIDADWFLEDIVAIFQPNRERKKLVDHALSEQFGAQLAFERAPVHPLTLKVGAPHTYSLFHLHQWVLMNQERTLFNQAVSLKEIDSFPGLKNYLLDELSIRRGECVWAFDEADVSIKRGILNKFRQRITRLSASPADIDRYRGGVPNFPLYPPLSEDFDDPKFGWFLKVILNARLRTTLNFSNTTKNIYISLFQDYIDRSELEQDKAILLRRYMHMIDYSNDDEDFGRQIIQGVTCNQIFRFTHATTSTQSIFAKIVGQGNKSSYFILDYLEDLRGVPLNQDDGRNWYCAPAAVLLKSDKSDGTLKPIAIFLRPDGQAGAMFTPNDTKTWRVAKAFARCAMFSIHQMINHAFRTHFASEVYFTALYRQLPTTHPLYILLYPHMRYVAGINDKARTTLVSKGGKFDDISAITGSTNGHLLLFQKEFKRYDCFKISNLPQDLETRGFGQSEEELPHYYFAQDARALYDIFFDYSKSILDVAYGVDATINDAYVNEFLVDVRHGFAVDGKPGNDGLGPHVDRKNIKTGNLAELVAQVIFMSSAQHAAVNFGQLMQYGNVENGPAHLRLPPPSSASQTVADIKDYLPEKEKQISQMTTGYTLSSRNLARDRSLLVNPDPETVNFFNSLTQHHPDYAPICWRIHDKLNILQTNIIQRNADLIEQNKFQYVYDWLLPSKVPISIAI